MKSIFTFILFYFFTACVSYSFATIGLVGGQNGTEAYAAFVDENGNLTPLNLGIPNGTIGFSYDSVPVAINALGLGLVGGKNFSGPGGARPPYAAFVDSKGSVTTLSLGTISGSIRGVAINDSGVGIVVGEKDFVPYAAYVTSDDSVNPITLTGFPVEDFGLIYSASINALGTGLLGGFDTDTAAPYVAFVSLQNPTIHIPLFISVGVVISAAINDSGIGLIGGRNDDTFPSELYAAFIDSGGSLSPITLGVSNGQITTVAMNASGAGIIGGNVNIGPGYAALVVSGQSTPSVVLSNIPVTTNSVIKSVAINSSGVGIIGGQGDPNNINATAGFAALVASDGTVTPLILNLTNALINAVAINDEGIGLIGGQDVDTGAAYGALVAPGGQLTSLNFSTFGAVINGVGISIASGGGGILQTVIPTSIGSNLGAFNSQFAASQALNTHMTGKHRAGSTQDAEEFALLVSASKNLPYNLENLPYPQDNQNMIWLSPFGNYVYQSAQGDIPSVSNSIGGFLLGYDYSYSDLMFGGAFGYAYNYLAFGSGHGSIQEELLTFYGSYEQECLLMNFALWGGLYQWYNQRTTLSLTSSKAHTQGWTFTPHFEIATPFKRGISFEPFVMFDYVSNWQGGYTEQGASGLNLVMDHHYSSVLRSEAGLRLFEEWNVTLGKFVFIQKVSYVNQLPFYFNSVTTSFVASSSSFPIAIGSSHVQNLGGVEVRGTFLPENDLYPYITFGFQGEFGSSYQSYFGNIEIGKAF